MFARIVVVIAVAGCGSKEPDSTPRPATVSLASKRTTDLSISETAELCKVLGERIALPERDALRLACTPATRAAGCVAELERCLKAPPVVRAFDCAAFREVMSCSDLTVADLDACVTEQLAAERAVLDAEPCAATPAVAAPTCRAIEIKCRGSIAIRRSGAAAQAVARMHAFTEAMCACRDKPCADKVDEEMTAWGTEMAKTAGAERDDKPSFELTKRSADLMARYTECMARRRMADFGMPSIE